MRHTSSVVLITMTMGALPGFSQENSISQKSDAKALTADASRDVSLQYCVELYENGEYGKAATIARNIRDKFKVAQPKLADGAAMVLGMCYHKGGQPDKAIASWSEALNNGDSDAARQAAIMLAWESIFYGRYEEAKATLAIIIARYVPDPIAAEAQAMSRIVEKLEELSQKKDAEVDAVEFGDKAGDQVKQVFDMTCAVPIRETETPSENQDGNAEPLYISGDDCVKLILERKDVRDDPVFCLQVLESCLAQARVPVAKERLEDIAWILRYFVQACPEKSCSRLRARALLCKCLRLAGKDIQFCALAVQVIDQLLDPKLELSAFSKEEQNILLAWRQNLLATVPSYCMRLRAPAPQQIFAQIAQKTAGTAIGTVYVHWLELTFPETLYKEKVAQVKFRKYDEVEKAALLCLRNSIEYGDQN